MDQTMEMGKSTAMGENPDMAKEKMLMMEKDKLKAMIDGMDADQLAMMGEVMTKMDETQKAEGENPGPDDNQDTSLDWNEPKASVDRKLSKMGMG